MDPTNSNATRVPVDDVGEITVNGSGMSIRAEGCRFFLTAADSLAVLEALRDNEIDLMATARAAVVRQQWEDAWAVARELIAGGVHVQGITPDIDGALRITVASATEIHENAGESVVHVETHGDYDHFTAEMAPGVLMAAYEVRPQAVA